MCLRSTSSHVAVGIPAHTRGYRLAARGSARYHEPDVSSTVVRPAAQSRDLVTGESNQQENCLRTLYWLSKTMLKGEPQHCGSGQGGCGTPATLCLLAQASDYLYSWSQTSLCHLETEAYRGLSKHLLGSSRKAHHPRPESFSLKHTHPDAATLLSSSSSNE